MTSPSEIAQILSKIPLEKIIKKSPLKKVVCVCGNKIYSFCENKHKVSTISTIKCPKCHRTGETVLEKDWEINIPDIIDCLSNLQKHNILRKFIASVCPKCMKIKILCIYAPKLSVL
jgi:hypothetical protein